MSKRQPNLDRSGSDLASFSPGVDLALAQGRQARAEADAIIKGYAIAAAGVGLAPWPVIDAVLLADVQMNLVGRLADHYGVPFTAFGRAMLASLLTGAAPVLVTGAGLSALKVVPVFGSLAGGATLSSLSLALTYAVGRVVADHLEAGGTLDDLGPAVFRRRLRAELRASRQVASAAAPA